MQINVTTSQTLACLIDNTLLSPAATRRELEALCEESRQYGFRTVAVNPAAIVCCREFLSDSKVEVDAAIAFPLGQNSRRSGNRLCH